MKNNIKDIKALILQRGWMSFAGAATLIIVPNTLTSAEQGLFFTFLSIAAIQSIFDAGVTSAFLNYIAHEKAKLTSLPASSVLKRQEIASRILTLTQMAKNWFLILSFLFIAIVGSIGYYFIENATNKEDLTIEWKAPFIILIIAISQSINNLSRIPVLEAHGLIAEVAKYRLKSNICSMIILWATMIIGEGLWGIALCYGTQVILMTYQCNNGYKNLKIENNLQLETKNNRTTQISWKAEILPLQARLAGSYFAGYFISQAVIPYTLHNHGAKIAGEVGLTLAIFNAIATIVSSYIYASGPRYASLIAIGNLTQLSEIFKKVTTITVITATCIYSAVLVFMVLIQETTLEIADRLINPEVILFMVIIGITNAYVGSAATLLRAQKKEPMLVASLATASSYIVAMATMQTMQTSSIEGLYFSFTIVQLLVTLPLTIMAIKRSSLLSK